MCRAGNAITIFVGWQLETHVATSFGSKTWRRFVRKELHSRAVGRSEHTCREFDMGYELWTSPVTGYRRHGTRLRDFNDSLGSKIRVSEIAESLRSCPAMALSEDVVHLLEVRDFDIAGVRTSEDSPVLGFVRREDLKSGLVQNHVQDIDEQRVVMSDMILPHLLERLGSISFVFVLSGDGITGILTLADLNKPIVRAYLFGLISLLEIHMGYWASIEYPGETWRDALSSKRMAAAARKQEERKRRGQHLGLFQCLEFGDKKILIAKSKQLRQMLNLGSRNKTDDLLGDAENLRNSLAHSQYDLSGHGSWSNLIALVQKIQAVISTSDAAVEARASELASKDMGALW